MAIVVDMNSPNQWDEETMDANAALIAAAPDMYEMLTGIIALIGNVDHEKRDGANSALMRGGMLNDIREMAARAIAKAKP